MADVQSASFASLLRRHRIASGLTQEELAERAGLSVRAISDLERGARRSPYRETVRALADAMRLSAEQAAALDALIPRRQGPNTLGRADNTLPVEVTPLIGREREEAEAVHMMRWGGIRILTFTGPGGVGKTRLASRVAGDLAGEYDGGVFFVALAALRDPALVLPALGRSLGLRESGTDRLSDTLVAALSRKDVLLVLDNLEQILEAALDIERLVDVCPRVAVLATSRTLLGVRAEQVLEVGPLALPEPVGPTSSARLRRYPAATLFVERARSAVPDFTPDRREMAAIAQICRRLDGLPLAVELAAAQMRLVGPVDLLALLDRRLPALTGGPADLPERQRTMRDTIAWSYDLLDKPSQRLFRELCVFSNGFVLDAAAQVGTDLDGDTDEAMERIIPLAESSLLSMRDDGSSGSARFTMLETIREFGEERLDAENEGRLVRRRHAAYMLSLFAEAADHLRGPAQADWLWRLEEEHDNLRAALGFLLADGSPREALQLATRATRFWWLHSHLREGRHWLREAMSQADDLPDDLHADALCNSGVLALAQGDYSAAASFLEAGLTLSRVLNDPTRIARMLNYLAVTRQEEGQYERAVDLHRESLVLSRHVGNTLGVASSLNNLAIVLEMLEQYDSARALLQESLNLQRDLGDTRGMASTLHNLGNIALIQSRIEDAVALMDEAFELYTQVGDRRGIAKTRGALARAAMESGEVDRARALARESIRLAHDVGDRTTVAELLAHLAEIAYRDGDLAAAIRLFAATDALHSTGGPAPNPRVRARRDEFRAALRLAVDGDTWSTLWDEGRTMSGDEATALACAFTETHQLDASGGSRRGRRI